MADYGLDIFIPFVGDPDPTLPWADDDDRRLVPGSLVLIDFAHSLSPVTAVPGVGATVPNIAEKRVIDLLGSAAFTATISGTTMTVTARSAGALKAGQVFAGTGVTTGTYILAQLSSSEPGGALGGAGAYSISASHSIGSATAMSVAPATSSGVAVVRAGTADTSGVLATELTGKGALHVMISQTNNTANNQGLAIELVQLNLLWKYIIANFDHDFYFSVWDRVTRVATNNLPPQASFGQNTSNYLFYMNQTGSDLVGPGGTSYSSPSDPNLLGERFRAIDVLAHSGGAPGPSMNSLSLASFGPIGPYGSLAATVGNKSASRVLRAMYFEDRTVSGRTFAQVRDADFAFWQADIGPGGRYANDTFTTPSI